ncbi:hypothetical protein LAZ67_X002837 [Cordylochernes scorpioides]|uniref:Mos1 transposase HTH domain-containing protein n=1 Tax=Cordylochernes scorpioides TaxID=51811 RepID=A0ABY6LTN5_9ARAC|nr:hypothetical protein LAZ67_X002837 [Cordylochernes scorpioides]
MDERKEIKFYRKVILNIFHRVLLNSFILYEKHTKDNPKLSRSTFNYSAIAEIIKSHLKPPVQPSTSPRKGWRNFWKRERVDVWSAQKRPETEVKNHMFKVQKRLASSHTYCCGNFTIEQKLKQRICIEFCVELQISETETFEMLNKAFPNDAPKRTTIFEWHSRFKAGRISIEDDPRQGCPKFQRTDENGQKITDLIKENPRTTLLELEQDTGISKTTIGRIATEDLKFLINEQKLCRLATCEDMLEMTRTDPEWKDKIIAGKETWVYGYDLETKHQSAEWRGQGEPRPKKSRNKVLLVAFLDNKGIVYHKYLPTGQTVIKKMYLGILRCIRVVIRKKKGQKNGHKSYLNQPIPQKLHQMTFSCSPNLKQF